MVDRLVLNDGEPLGVIRGKINTNFLEYNNAKIEAGQVLIRTNTSVYSPITPYNPATKLYADDLHNLIKTTYDPQGINGDSFDLNLHTGNIGANQVTQDINNRFITDAERIAWNAKENAIGTKKTAFNKDFGTIAGTVAEGNHVHTGTYEPFNANIQIHIATVGNPHGTKASDIEKTGGGTVQESIDSISEVDNTSDANKPLSDDTVTALATKQTIGDPISYAQFDANAGEPLYQKGRIFYDLDHESVSGMCEIEGVVINFGFEDLIRVYNNTASTIKNGKPLYKSGIHPTNGLIYVGLAKADNYNTSLVRGLATHDIPPNTIGLAAVRGGVHEVDTNGFSIGDTLYVSDTVAGEYVTSPPSIASRVGEVRKAGETEGVIFADLNSNISLPPVFAVLDGNTDAPFTLTTTVIDINDYTNEEGVGCGVDKATGYLNPDYTGKYRLNFTMSCSFTSITSGARTINLELYDETDDIVVAFSDIAIPKDIGTGSRSFSPLVDAVEGHDYVMRIGASQDVTLFSINNISYDIESVLIR